MHDLTGFQRDLLYVIAGREEPHGLALKDELEDYYEKEIHHGRLYPNLDTLVEKGLVEKGQQDRRTNSYEAHNGGNAKSRRAASGKRSTSTKTSSSLAGHRVAHTTRNHQFQALPAEKRDYGRVDH
jgi:PadR family transcriptional regulator PadR